ncbi:MAG: DUF922 domain-containing protein [Ginsengibacter sp.]
MTKYKHIITVVISILVSLQAFPQKITINVFIDYKANKTGSDTIYYDVNRKLNWQDFQATPPVNAQWGAMTASGFSFNSSMTNDGNNMDIAIAVFTFFTQHDSWKRPDIHSDYHLEHEQRHFDITRLGSEKLVDELRKAKFTRQNYRKIMHSIFDKVYEENSAMQQEYDRETKHSMDTVKQNEWNGRIAMEIEKLKKTVARN